VSSVSPGWSPSRTAASQAENQVRSPVPPQPWFSHWVVSRGIPGLASGSQTSPLCGPYRGVITPKTVPLCPSKGKSVWTAIPPQNKGQLALTLDCGGSLRPGYCVLGLSPI
jgi:hypothetical protein